jgi:hypothetical protein
LIGDGVFLYRSVFAGSIVWMGTGAITVPSTWDTTDLGSGCAPPSGLPIRGFDLSNGQAAARLDEAAAVVLQTALPAAFNQWGYLFNAAVILYPRTLGAFAADRAEYVVLLNAGWLE